MRHSNRSNKHPAALKKKRYFLSFADFKRFRINRAESIEHATKILVKALALLEQLPAEKRAQLNGVNLTKSTIIESILDLARKGEFDENDRAIAKLLIQGIREEDIEKLKRALRNTCYWKNPEPKGWD